MEEGHDPRFGTGGRGPAGDDLGRGPNGVTGEDRPGELHRLETQVGDCGPQRQLIDGQADQQAEGEEAVYQGLTELGGRGELVVEVQRLQRRRIRRRR